MMRRTLFFCFFCLGSLVFFINKAEARLVMVIYGKDCKLETQEAARDFVVAEALLAETEEYLAQRIPEERRPFIRRYLSMVSQGLVLGVVEAGEVDLGNEKKRGAFEVSIRKNGLRSLLSELGITYTMETSQPYALSKDIEQSEEDFKDIRLLERVSGVIRSVAGASGTCPELCLKKEGNDWTALISSPGEEPIQERGLSLDMVWRGAWGKFFARRQAEMGLSAVECSLKVSGWRNGAGVEDLEKALASWVSCVNKTLLRGISFNKTITAQWTIFITKEKAFKEKMTQYALARKLEYVLSAKTSGRQEE